MASEPFTIFSLLQVSINILHIKKRDCNLVKEMQTIGKKISLCHSFSPFSRFEQRLEFASALKPT
jgi:hypothetical protein